MKSRTLNRRRGFTTFIVLGFSVLILGLATGLMNLVTSNTRVAKHRSESVEALEVAEAGVNYYLWHLSHDPEDYCDGAPCQGNPPYGPFTHEYKNAAGEVIGTYTLTVSPPSVGETAVRVTAQGETTGGRTRKIETQLGLPSFSQYAWVLNNRVWFGPSATTYGPVHSNEGIRFDGHAEKLVTSARTTYDARCVGGANGAPGIWSQGNVGVFDEGKQFPVTAVDFQKLAADLSQIKTDAQASGLYLPSTTGNRRGYYLKLNTNGIETYYVTGENKYARSGGAANLTKQLLATYPIPQNGLVFAEANLWIEGTTDDRLTIAAARFPDIPSQRRDIVVVDNIRYTVEDGTVALGLVAQRDIRFAHYTPPAGLEVDSYLLAANGGIGFVFSNNTQNRSTKASFINNGGFGSYKSSCDATPENTGYGMVTSANNDGFLVRNYYFDQHLTYSPPPQFPATGSFAVISWQEIETD